jgi:putative membrane protein
MKENPYAKFKRDSLILRDFLAVDRTVLANERTYLAYIRTALAMLILGISGLQFIQVIYVKVIGGTFVVLGIITFIVGFKRYEKMKKQINKSIKK